MYAVSAPFSGLEAAEKPAENENMFLFPDESRRKAEPGCNDDKESQEEAVTSHDASETVSTSAEQSSHPGSHKCHPSRAEKVRLKDTTSGQKTFLTPTPRKKTIFACQY